MHRSVLYAVLILSTALLAAAEPVAPPALKPEQLEFFEKRIRPILAENCYKCHSAQSEKLKAELRLDSRPGMLKGGKTGPAVVPGNIEKSLLIKALRYTDSDLQMPPKQRLKPEQVADFETWIKMGAPDPRTTDTGPPVPAGPAYNYEQARKFWSFQPPKDSAPPAVKNKAWPKAPVDFFILSKLEEKGLTPAGDAEKRVLLRRATFDLTGLPPTPEEIESFLKDNAPDAYEKIVNRLLASQQYGERWGRHWLDVVRYADTSGCNSDYPIASAYMYRNYVIDSFNHDKPYDQFLREQIAGDLLGGANNAEKFERIVATGFLALSRRFGSGANEFHLTLEDTIDTVGKSMFGLSIGCARCHDHKFDPIPNTDYYAMYGIFNSTRYAFPGTELFQHPKDFIPLVSPAEAEAAQKTENELAALDVEIKKLNDERMELERLEKIEKKDEAQKPPEKTENVPATGKEERTRTVSQIRMALVKAALEDAKSRQKALEARMPQVPRAYAVAEGVPADAKVQRKGDPTILGDEVPRGFLTILGGQQLPKGEAHSGRLEFVKWMTDPRINPLVARVMVNRIWQHHFGRGIVHTPNDFGARGAAPTHPELLDYLTLRFIEDGWSVKAMHRRLMLSHAYQLASAHDAGNAEIDPDNEWFWKFSRRRLSAEEIRDSILAVSGSLDKSMGGPHPFPPQNQWHYTQHQPFVAVYETNRRSVYLFQQRIKKHPFLEVFDGADTNATTAGRTPSTTALQALYLMNDPFMHEQADMFAVRVGMACADDNERIQYAHELAYGRQPTADEVKVATDYLRESRLAMKQAGLPFERQNRAALASYMRVIMSSNEFLFAE